MKKTTYIVLLSLILINLINAQTESNDFFVLNGTIEEDFNNKYLYLEYENLKDSCLIINNKFEFTGKLTNEPIQGIFSLKNKLTNIPTFYLENSKIQVKLSIKEKRDKGYFNVKIISVKGTNTIVIQNDFKEFFKKKNEEYFNKKLLKKLDSAVILNPNNGYLVSLIFSLSRSDKFEKEMLRKIYLKTNKETQSEFYKTKINQNLFKTNFSVYGSFIPNQ